jgi:hypothetical protein
MPNIDILNSYQIHIKLPEIFTRRFAALIPSQRERVNQLLDERVILNYALSMDRSNLWVTLQAKDQVEVMDILATFPIIKDVTVDIFELAFFDSAHVGMPEIIMN